MKNTSSLGKSYFERAAQQIEWPVNIGEKYIDVPQDELDKAEQDLMVSHLLANGFKIQSVIPGSVIKNKVYDPEFILKGVIGKRKEIEIEQERFKVGDCFKIVSTSCQLEITNLEKGKIHFKYTNRMKNSLLSSEENLVKMLNNKYWVQL